MRLFKIARAGVMSTPAFIYVIFVILLILTLGSASCSLPLIKHESTPTVPTPAPTVTPTPRDPTYFAAYAKGYRWSKGITGQEAKQAIIEHGFREELDAMETEYHYRGIVKRLSSNFVLPVAYEGSDGFHWNLTALANDGHFLKFTVRTGKETNFEIQDIGMADYHGNAPLFQVEELPDPEGVEYVAQDIIWDQDGWAVFGAFQGDTLVAWFDPFSSGGGRWVRLDVPLLTATPIVPIQIALDKSRFEAVETSDGVEIQGYVIEDEFGSRMVDSVNTIILVNKDGAWKLPEHKESSEFFPAVFSETKTAVVAGMEIPMTLGLTENVQRSSPHFVFHQIHMTQKAADLLAPQFLYYAYVRYRDLMYHPETTYEEYLVLLKQGFGNIEILDSKTKTKVLIDPRQGFSVVITGDDMTWMPVRGFYDKGLSFSTDDLGRLLIASNAAKNYDMIFHYGNERTRQLSLADSAVVFSLYLISFLEDQCMLTSDTIENQCANISAPKDVFDAEFSWNKAYRDFYTGVSDNPLIWFY